jgi:uncharacterized protein (TIGR00730 family)
MPTLCVYLGAKSGNSSKYKEAVISLGSQLAELGIDLIYGGSSLGLMGELARCTLKNGGKVTGIITESLLSIETPQDGLDNLLVVKTIAERKSMMIEKSDAFLVFPGGIGTLEEAFETLNAIKIGLINKKIGFLNIGNYFDDLFKFIHNCSSEGFVKQNHTNIPILTDNVLTLIKALFRFNKVID